MLKTAPAVFAVGNDYQIMARVEKESLFWIKAGSKNYYDESNGIMNSLSELHRVTIPMKDLEIAGEYTVCVKPIIERKPYFTETDETVEKSFKFYPVPEKNVRAYHISDAHNKITQPVKAANTFGRIDMLILNGDILDHSGDPGKFSNIYEICSALTGGSIPVVFSRGNHDMRGKFAEKFAEYTPNQHGNTFYSFRLGCIWGLLIDGGEDKNDDHPEYGLTVACHAFRERQSLFIKKIISDAEKEYAADGVKIRLIISHKPFTERDSAPFDIEEEICREWSELLREHIKPDLMLCGHTHQIDIRYPGSEKDTYGQACPVIVASHSEPVEEYFAGCGFIFGDYGAEVIQTDSDGQILSSNIVRYGNQ